MPKLGNQEWFDYFEISTLHREVTCEFADGELNSQEWIKLLYEKKTRNFAKKLLKSFGVKKTRTRLKRHTNKLH